MFGQAFDEYSDSFHIFIVLVSLFVLLLFVDISFLILRSGLLVDRLCNLLINYLQVEVTLVDKSHLLGIYNGILLPILVKNTTYTMLMLAFNLSVSVNAWLALQEPL